jgi:hypothetical protein
MADSTELDTVFKELTAARAALAATVARVRRRHHGFIALSVLSCLFLVGYLGFAASRFGGDVTPDLIAANMQAAFQNALPATRLQLQQSLKDNAPKVVNGTFDQLQQMPVAYADSLQREATERMDAAMPAVQDQIYQSMKRAIEASTTSLAAGGGTAKDDETRLKVALAAVSDVYATETIKFVDQLHGTYAADALAFTDYLERLATAPNLDHRDQLHREMFRTIFALVRSRAATSGGSFDDATAAPAATTMPSGS